MTKKVVIRTMLSLFFILMLSMSLFPSLSFGTSFHGDSPWDAPREELRRPETSSIGLSSSSGTEFSPSSDADPWVKFKVNEGWDLDQYLFKESSPIDIYIDVDDFKPDPTISPPPVLTLRVYDVDYDAPVHPQERDLVVINDHAIDFLTGANNMWSTWSRAINPSFIVEGNNHIQIIIDVLNDGWAVEVDWAELKIPFNIKVTKIEVVDGTDITIKDITDPVWEKKFDANGKLIDVVPKRDYPIADWFKSNNFKVKITVDAWPKKPLKLNPFIIVYGWTEAGLTLHSFFGWEGEYEVNKLPQKVLKTYLGQEFAFLATPGHIADRQFTNHILYLTLEEPLADVKPPREEWLDNAVEWASGAKNENEVANKLLESIYGTGWTYDPANSYTWQETKSNHVGDCKSYAWLWKNLCKVHGINKKTITIVGSYELKNPAGQVIESGSLGYTTKNLRALDGQQMEWGFNYHQVGSDGGVFDPVFNKKGSLEDYEKILFKEFTPTFSTPPVAGVSVPITGNNLQSLITDKMISGTFTHAGQQYRLTVSLLDGTSVWNDPEVNFTTVPANLTVVNTDKYFYELDEPIYITSEAFLNGTILTGLSVVAQIQRPGETFNVSLYDDGTHGDSAASDGIYSLLYIDTSVQGGYRIRVFVAGTVNGSPFESEAILPNGVYVMKIGARMTGGYWDRGLDTDADGLFDILESHIELNVTSAGNYTIAGLLRINETILSGKNNVTCLFSGIQDVILHFDGSVIRKFGVDGPYSLETIVLDHEWNYLDERTFNTSTFTFTQFDQPLVVFNGQLYDYGTDIDSDGLYNYLSIEAGVNVTVAGNYSIIGCIYDYGDSYIASAYNYIYLDTGTQSVALNFDGATICKEEVDGPYNLRYLRLYDPSGNETDSLENAYNTSAYSYTEFQKPEAVFTGTYSDYGVDTDIGSTYTRTYLPHEWIGSGTPMGWHGDDNSWSYILPFDFPFYGTNYATIHISSNGLITFLSPDSSYSNSISVLASKLAIAPAWDDWKTYDPYDIYIWQNSTHVGIRWHVQAYGTGVVANFEAILSANGVIQFNYGNTTGAVSATIGISNGVDDILAEEATNLNDINTIIFTPAGDGLFNFLTIQVELSVTKAGNYTLEGALYDFNGSLIVWATSRSNFDIGTQLFVLNFDGVAIYSHGINGSYNLGLLRLYDEVGSIVDMRYNAYNTTTYNYTDFQKPRIKLAGIFSDYGIDTDTDGFYNYLAVQIEVLVQYSGTYDVNARLIDINGNEIIWASNSTYLNEDIPQTIQLNFDGRYIFGNGVNGPYYVKDLSIYYSNIALYVSDVYATSTYNHTQFQKSAIVLGTVTDTEALPVADALVYISAVDYEYTNVNGSYKLIILQAGTYTVEVIPPPELNLLGNCTIIDITVGETKILNFILRPIEINDVALVNVTPSKTVVGQGYSLSINVTAANQGNYAETFNITIYANTTVIETQTVNNLLSGASAVLTSAWNTTDFDKGNYTISAYAEPVFGETNVADNNLTGGWVIVSIVGDITGPTGWPDGKVDIRDISAVARLFGIARPDPRYNPNYDINDDGKIDIKDISTVARRFGEHYP